MVNFFLGGNITPKISLQTKFHKNRAEFEEMTAIFHFSLKYTRVAHCAVYSVHCINTFHLFVHGGNGQKGRPIWGERLAKRDKLGQGGRGSKSQDLGGSSFLDGP